MEIKVGDVYMSRYSDEYHYVVIDMKRATLLDISSEWYIFILRCFTYKRDNKIYVDSLFSFNKHVELGDLIKIDHSCLGIKEK